MRAAAIAIFLPFLVLAQTDGNLDTITLNGRPCPPEGDARSPDVKDLNRLKNRYHTPVASDIDPTVTLTAMVAPGDDETRFDNKSAATITGFVLKVLEGSVESCNCQAKAANERDTHIQLTLSEGADRTQAVIVEVTPRTRLLHQKAGANDWTTAALERDIQGKWVEISGWLMFDFEHVGEAENTNPGGAHNVRATAWEIHPVTAIKVLDSPPPDSARLAPAVVKAFQRCRPSTSIACRSGSSSSRSATRSIAGSSPRTSGRSPRKRGPPGESSSIRPTSLSSPRSRRRASRCSRRPGSCSRRSGRRDRAPRPRDASRARCRSRASWDRPPRGGCRRW